MLNYYLNPVRRQMNDWFGDFFAPSFATGNFSDVRTNITENDNEYLIEMQLAGYGKEDVKISLNDGYIKVEASKNTESNSDEKKYISREIYYGSVSRSFYVGNVDINLIKANFNNGILEISIPKEELPIEDKTQYIAID